MSSPSHHAVARVLVVDDEAMVRRITTRILRDEKYSVVEASGCAEARHKLHTMHDRFDLVIVDVVMPDCEGLTLAREIRERWPDQRILFVSGYSTDVLRQHGLNTFDAPFLAKPYTSEQALTKVREVLRQPKPAPKLSSD